MPYHLAHGLLDYAQHPDDKAAEAAITKAREIAAGRAGSGCWAADLMPAGPPV
jgi:hypothetical protein